MYENGIISQSKNHLLRYRYILIAILVIIIALLILVMAVIFKNTNKKNNVAISDNNNNNNEQEQAMLVELDNKKKEEEQREKEKEKQEEENATGIIHLTFDDGPSSDITPEILNILKEKGVKATFFLIHFSEKNAELVKREDNEGHTVALHGYSHTYSEVYSSADACLDNFRKIQ